MLMCDFLMNKANKITCIRTEIEDGNENQQLGNKIRKD